MFISLVRYIYIYIVVFTLFFIITSDEFIGQICHFHDTLWVHSDYKNELNWDAFKALNSYLNTTIYDVK